MNTLFTMLFGAIMAGLIAFPLYAFAFEIKWGWVSGFPVGYAYIGLAYMNVFFHEIGHALAGWFYGQPAVPTFDLVHGGGMAWMGAEPLYPLLICAYGFVAYRIYKAEARTRLRIILGSLLIFSAATVWFEDIRMTVIDGLGPVAPGFVAVFFLIRALFNMAPRGWVERFMNALCGFGLLFYNIIEAYALMTSEFYRQRYYTQKGAHGFGDFDKIVSRLDWLSFDMAMIIWLCISLLCLILPFIIFIIYKLTQEV